MCPGAPFKGGPFATDEVKPGDFHWVDSKMTHTLTNVRAAEGQIVEIELKSDGHQVVPGFSRTRMPAPHGCLFLIRC